MVPPRRDDFITTLEQEWETDPRWVGITRPYSAADVYRLSGSVAIEYSLARFGAARLRELLGTEPYLPVLSAITGNQAIQQVQAGLKAIYVSGWQVTADANHALEMYPDQSLYPSDSVPMVRHQDFVGVGYFDEVTQIGTTLGTLRKTTGPAAR